jgi:hypothetical protein
MKKEMSHSSAVAIQMKKSQSPVIKLQGVVGYSSGKSSIDLSYQMPSYSTSL